jgi:hypothetical protein
MHGDNMSYAENFDAALNGLFEDRPPGPQAGVQRAPSSVRELGIQLNAAFSAWLEALGKRQFDAAAEQLNRLSELIDRASNAQETMRPSGGKH